MEFKLFSFLVALVVAFVSVFLMPAQSLADEQEFPGSISVCKIVVDENSNVVSGADKAGASFSISGFTPNPATSQDAPAGVLPTTTFTTPLTYNTDLLGGIPGNDADCVTYNNLPLGSYYYTQESNSGSDWDTAYYSDQYTGPVSDVVSLYPYDNNLFDGNLSNDDSRNLDADGNIILNEERPTRVLVIVNRYKTGSNVPPFVPTPTTGGSTPSNPEAPKCSDPNTVKTVANLQAARNGDKATVSFFITDGNTADIFYKEKTVSDWQYSLIGVTPNVDKFVSVEIGGLNPNAEYAFGVRQRIGCGGGDIAVVDPISNEPQVLGASTMAGTGTAQETLMNLYAIFGMLLVSAGFASYAKEKKAI